MSGRNDATAPGERIAKVMARAGLASRRAAEAWIAAGRVAVNGKVVASPALNVTAGDRIFVDGAPLPMRERTRLFLHHKLRGLVTTHADPGGRRTIFDVLPKSLPRLVSVGRLDMSTEGLLLLTNDGGLARALELPATGWLRRYRVRAHGRVSQDQLDGLRSGIAIDGVRYGPIEARLEREQGSNIWLTFAIREGKNREVKNVLGHLGLAVNRLIRVSFGPFQLGELAEGDIEEVRTRTLREQLGERLAALAGVDFSGPRIERTAPAAPISRHLEVPASPDLGFARDRDSLTRKLRVRASKDDRPGPKVPISDKPEIGGRAPQGEGERRRSLRPPAVKRKLRRRDPDRIGQPELARLEKRRGRRPARGSGKKR